MAKKLNTWARLAIVITVPWLIGCTLFVYLPESKALEREYANFTPCHVTYDELQAANPKTDFASDRAGCLEGQAYYVNSRATETELVARAFLTALAIAAVFWAIVGVVVWSSRWVLAGRSKGAGGYTS